MLLLLCCALRRDDSRGKPQAGATSFDARRRSDSEKTGACGKVKRQHMEHIADKGARSFHYGLVQKPVPVQVALKIPKIRSRCGKRVGQNCSERKSVGCKESEIKVRTHPSGEEGWKKQFTWRI